MRIGVLGAGAGRLLLLYCCINVVEVSMWEFNPQDAEMLHRSENIGKAAGPDSDDVDINNDIAATVKASEIIICAVPSQTMRSTMKRIAQLCTDKEISSIQGWVIVAKGIETDTLKLMTDVLLEELPQITSDKLLVLSGPSHAEEVSRDIPSTVVAASENRELALKIQENFSTDTFRIYTNNDIRGVELAGSVKNVVLWLPG